MDIEFTKCDVTESDIRLTIQVIETFKAIKGESSYRLDGLAHQVIEKISQRLASEYRAVHKMDILNQISNDEVTKRIQLKIIEGFTLNKRQH